jgi:hypothetical protein
MARIITIQQPLAWGIVHGHKPVENRGWETDYRGPIWIHAGKNKTNLLDTDPEDWYDEPDGTPFLPGCPEWKDLDLGKIIGMVDLVDCVTDDEATNQLGDNPHINGPWCFLLANPRVLKEPIPWSGQFGISTIPLEPKDEMFFPPKGKQAKGDKKPKAKAIKPKKSKKN